MVALVQTAEAKEVFINKQKFDASTKPLTRKRHKRAGSFAPSCFTRRQKILFRILIQATMHSIR